MKYCSRYESPLGMILLEADEEGLAGLRFLDRNNPLPKEQAFLSMKDDDDDRNSEVIQRLDKIFDINIA